MWRISRSISAARQGFASGSLSPLELMEESLRAAQTVEKLNAFTWMDDKDRLLCKAQESWSRWKRGAPIGLLDGIPVSVKDNFSTNDERPTTCGSKMLHGYRPTYNAEVVERLESAGAILVGKTNLDEFAMGCGTFDSAFGPSRSLWRSGIDYELTDGEGRPVAEGVDKGAIVGDNVEADWVVAGGSSGGSAVSVSSGVAVASIGSDTGGSARVPGAWNGVCTLKPTYGAISRRGLIPLVNSLDCPSIMASSVDDVAEIFNIVKGMDPGDSTTLSDDSLPDVHTSGDPDISPLTVGLPAEYRCEDMEDEVVQSWSDVTDLLDNNGIKVRKVSLPHTQYSITCYSVLNPCEVASNMARYDGLRYGRRGEDESSTEAMYEEARREGLNDVVRSRILTGNFFLLKRNYDDFFIKALKVRRLVKSDFDAVWRSGVDVLLTPATLSAAPTFSQFSRLDNRTQTSKHDYCTQPVNLAGLPAATVPVTLSVGAGLPLGLQIIGRARREQDCLSLAKWLQNRLGFPQIKLL